MADADVELSLASAEEEANRARRFEIKKWNAVALWAWGNPLLLLCVSSLLRRLDFQRWRRSCSPERRLPH